MHRTEFCCWNRRASAIRRHSSLQRQQRPLNRSCKGPHLYSPFPRRSFRRGYVAKLISKKLSIKFSQKAAPLRRSARRFSSSSLSFALARRSRSSCSRSDTLIRTACQVARPSVFTRSESCQRRKTFVCSSKQNTKTRRGTGRGRGLQTWRRRTGYVRMGNRFTNKRNSSY